MAEFDPTKREAANQEGTTPPSQGQGDNDPNSTRSYALVGGGILALITTLILLFVRSENKRIESLDKNPRTPEEAAADPASYLTSDITEEARKLVEKAANDPNAPEIDISREANLLPEALKKLLDGKGQEEPADPELLDSIVPVGGGQDADPTAKTPQQVLDKAAQDLKAARDAVGKPDPADATSLTEEAREYTEAPGKIQDELDKAFGVRGEKVIKAWTPEQLKEAIGAVQAEVARDYARHSDFELGRIYERYESLTRAERTIGTLLKTELGKINAHGVSDEAHGILEQLDNLILGQYAMQDILESIPSSSRPSKEMFLVISLQPDLALSYVPTSENVEDREAGMLLDKLGKALHYLRDGLDEPAFVHGLKLQERLKAQLQKVEAVGPNVQDANAERTLPELEEPEKKRAGGGR